MKKIFVAVIIILVASSLYFYSQNKSDTEQLSKSSNATEIKYSNQEFGFEFMLPSNWKETKTEMFGGITFMKSEKEASFQESLKSPGVVEGDGQAVVAMDTILFVIPLTITELDSHIAQFKQYDIDLGEIKVNGNVVTKINVNQRFGGGSEEHYIFRNGNSGILIIGEFTEMESSRKELKDVLDRAVSTFIFTQ